MRTRFHTLNIKYCAESPVNAQRRLFAAAHDGLSFLSSCIPNTNAQLHDEPDIRANCRRSRGAKETLQKRLQFCKNGTSDRPANATPFPPVGDSRYKRRAAALRASEIDRSHPGRYKSAETRSGRYKNFLRRSVHRSLTMTAFPMVPGATRAAQGDHAAPSRSLRHAHAQGTAAPCTRVYSRLADVPLETHEEGRGFTRRIFGEHGERTRGGQREKERERAGGTPPRTRDTRESRPWPNSGS